MTDQLIKKINFNLVDLNLNHLGLNSNLLRFILKSIEIENKSLHEQFSNHSPLRFIFTLCSLEIMAVSESISSHFTLYLGVCE